jgi:NAD(P)-dependent dehydrogenase (short-subunit alcohol dehydrogenase family)
LESSLKSHAASLWSPDCMAGKVVLVTGAGRGIGRETALTFAALGASVMGVSRTEGELADLAREAPVEYLAESVDTVEGCAHIIDETRRRLGGIDILINNAGVGSFRDSPIWDMSSEVWRESMATNLDGPFELTRLAITDMIQRNWGRVVMVGSTAGQFAWPAMSSYCASKHGLLGLTRAVAQDVGAFNVTCNAVMPGWVRTKMSDAKAELEAARRGLTLDEVWAQWSAEYPQGRVVTPEEIANTIVFLASESASGINGEAITVALGLT